MLLCISFVQHHKRCGYNRMTARQRAAVLAISVRALMRASPWNFSVFWSTESELPWNSPCVRDHQRGCLGDRIATLRVRHASNRVVMCGADGVRFRSASEPVRASLVFFMPVSAPRSTMPSRCSMPPQPDQLRCRHDRHDNGERTTALAVQATQWNQAKILQ